MKRIHWSELVVTDSEGNCNTTLGFIVRSQAGNLGGATIEDGRITEWPDFYLSAPGEEPEWDTPRCDVDWTGFTGALNGGARL